MRYPADTVARTYVTCCLLRRSVTSIAAVFHIPVTAARRYIQIARAQPEQIAEAVTRFLDDARGETA